MLEDRDVGTLFSGTLLAKGGKDGMGEGDALEGEKEERCIKGGKGCT